MTRVINFGSSFCSLQLFHRTIHRSIKRLLHVPLGTTRFRHRRLRIGRVGAIHFCRELGSFQDIVVLSGDSCCVVTADELGGFSFGISRGVFARFRIPHVAHMLPLPLSLLFTHFPCHDTS